MNGTIKVQMLNPLLFIITFHVLLHSFALYLYSAIIHQQTNYYGQLYYGDGRSIVLKDSTMVPKYGTMVNKYILWYAISL